MKIGYIVDSSSGLSQEQAHHRGWLFLPLLLTINGQEYMDGIDLKDQEFYKIIKQNSICKTSATPLAKAIKMFEYASERYDHIVVYGLSKKLSSQLANLKTFAKDFPNIHVIDSYGVGYAIVRDLEEVSALNDIRQIIAKLEQLSAQQYGIAFPKQLQWLVRGGRISPAIAGMANLLKIIPIIKFEHGALDKYGKGRVFSKAVIKTIKNLAKEHKNAEFMIYKGNYVGIEDTIHSIQEILGPIHIAAFPPVIASHTGPEVIAVIVRGKLLHAKY